MTWYGPSAPGRRPKYLDKPLTPAQRARIYRLRKKGVTVPPRDPLADLRAAMDTCRIAYAKGEGKDEAVTNLFRQLTNYLGEHDVT